MKYLNKKTFYFSLIMTAGFLLGMSNLISPISNERASLDDMEIAHIAYTAGNIDISYAHLALALSEDPAVRDFANTMIRDHSAINEKAFKLLQKLGANPKPNETSKKLMADSKAFKRRLMRLEGRAFDRLYARNELEYHQFVNETVENTFIPSVQNREFKNLLKSALQTFKVHEQHAKSMYAKLQ